MTTDDAADGPRRPPGWPSPEPEQVEVLLLGCYHMDDPGNDAMNVEADEVLWGARTLQLAPLPDRLADWAPNVVGVERPADWAEQLNATYERYRSGRRAYDEENPEAAADRRTPAARDEVVQVGFRLADRLGHDRVAAVDDPLFHEDRSDDYRAALETDDLWLPDERRRARYGLPEPSAYEREHDRRLRESTITEFLRWLNREQGLRENHRGMFAAAVPARGDGDPVGAVALGWWYERNVRTVHHLWRALDRDDERALLVSGSGHVRVLRHLLAETPMFCPVSALPSLASGGESER
jgi:hypothetical protein